MKEQQPELPFLPKPIKKERDPYEIVEMPDKNTLEDFLRGMSGLAKVIYRIDKGIFERNEKT